MPGFGDFLGRAGSAGEQLFIWGVLSTVVSAAMTPYVNALQQAQLERDPNTPLSPEAAADLVARHLIDQAAGADQAVKAGIDSGAFARMVKAASRGPDLGTLVTAYQRGLIARGGPDGEQLSLFGGLADTGLREDWLPVIEKLTTDVPTSQEVINAWLQGQLGEGEARRWLAKTGIDPDWIQTAYDATGEAPTPVQALTLANRGIIPWEGEGPAATSYRQAFLEGPWRNKWEKAFRALAEYLPPPRTVTAMYHAGQVDQATAADALKAYGLSDTWAQAYLKPGHTATSTATEKHLAKTDILEAFRDKIMTRPAAVRALEALHYSASDANLLLDLSDLRETTAQLRAGVSRVRALFQGGKITAGQARDDLAQLGIGHAEAADLIDTWGITQATKVRDNTPAQVEAAMYYDIITEAEAMSRLIAMGYDEAEAWLALAVRIHGPLKTIPRPAGLGPVPPRPELTNPGTPAP